ncbi:probable prefoldin subunit 4 [Oppia nitens]|uniref:probable prefoldin subunit 4 n=1 Tax=Oppia nitens TaxID=1686743 RepID=UPI0023DB7D8F|nr:probable prefoldin subunit 4 [Oppia nitens]
MANSSSTADCEVTLADQTLINRFARLNAKCDELEADVASAARLAENASDAINELLIADDNDGSGGLLVRCGEVFARMSAEEAEEWIEGRKAEIEDKTGKQKNVLSEMRTEMTKIKTTLYAKFGHNINLEYDDD